MKAHAIFSAAVVALLFPLGDVSQSAVSPILRAADRVHRHEVQIERFRGNDDFKLLGASATGGQLQPDDDVKRQKLFTQPGSKVTVEGQQTLHNWTVRGDEIKGWLEVVLADSAGANEMLLKKPAEFRGELAIPILSLRSSEGSVMTRDMRQRLKSDDFPEITFRFQQTKIEVVQARQTTSFRLIARGPLAIAGVTNEASIPIEVTPLGEKRFRLTGKTSLKMSSYSIDPPELPLSIPVRYHDEFTVLFEWIVGPPNDAPPGN